MTVGAKIKKFRTARELSQKQLALLTGMSEPAIRNYELGNRQPSGKQLEKIAGALGVSPLTLGEPDLETYYGLMHTLFALEDMYGLKPAKINWQTVLTLEMGNRSADTVANDLRRWCNELEKLKQGSITQEEYDHWRYTFPQVEAERFKAAQDALRAKERDKSE